MDFAMTQGGALCFSRSSGLWFEILRYIVGASERNHRAPLYYWGDLDHGVSIPINILGDTTVFLAWINSNLFFGSLELNDEFVLMGKFILQSLTSCSQWSLLQ